MADPQVIMKAIGPTFFSEVQAKGISFDGFSWSSDRVTIMPDMNTKAKAALLKVIAAHDATATLPAVLRVSKTEFWRRCNENEAAGFLSDLTETSAKLKAIFDSVQYLDSTAAEYPLLRDAIVNRVGDARADELLASSGD